MTARQVLAAAVCAAGVALRADVDARDFGAKGDGATKDTASLRTNAVLSVAMDRRDGSLTALALNADRHRMNWIEGSGRWGTLLGHSLRNVWGHEHDTAFAQPFFDCRSCETIPDGIVAHYALDDLRADVTRRLTDRDLVETYVFRNAGRVPLYFLRGHLGILTTFNDSYAKADECMVRRCHAHVFTGGEVSWVHALKMGLFDTELLLELEEGSLDGYSVRRKRAQNSNDRGDIVLHPAPFVLLPGESKTLRWRLRTVKAGSFVPPVRFKYETVFPGERFEVDVEGRHLTFPAGKPGEERVFDLPLANGRVCRARGYTASPLDELIERRIRFLVRHQQCRDPKSPLNGAFLPYSNVERRQYYDSRFSDHNACQERIGVGIFVVNWLKDHPDPEVAEAIDRYEAFVMRELLDPETGAAYGEIGRDPRRKRLYNAPGVISLVKAFHHLRGGSRYLDLMERMVRNHYAAGGAKCYSNGCLFSSVVRLLEQDGRDVSDLKRKVRAHLGRIIANGTNYPVHEVNFEQTIVSPASGLLLDWCAAFGREKEVWEAIPRQLEMLKRFDGDQPSHLQGGMAIRHWDGFWFGGDMLYGDTLQHLSALSARSYAMWAELSGDADCRWRAERCLRNLLYLYHQDGTGSACYYLPLSVTYLDNHGRQSEPTRKGEHFDIWSNDQDNGLYLLYQIKRSSP